MGQKQRYGRPDKSTNSHPSRDNHNSNHRHNNNIKEHTNDYVVQESQ